MKHKTAFSLEFELRQPIPFPVTINHYAKSTYIHKNLVNDMMKFSITFFGRLLKKDIVDKPKSLFS